MEEVASGAGDGQFKMFVTTGMLNPELFQVVEI